MNMYNPEKGNLGPTFFLRRKTGKFVFSHFIGKYAQEITLIATSVILFFEKRKLQ